MDFTLSLGFHAPLWLMLALLPPLLGLVTTMARKRHVSRCEPQLRGFRHPDEPPAAGRVGTRYDCQVFARITPDTGAFDHILGGHLTPRDSGAARAYPVKVCIPLIVMPENAAAVPRRKAIEIPRAVIIAGSSKEIGSGKVPTLRRRNRGAKSSGSKWWANRLRRVLSASIASHNSGVVNLRSLSLGRIGCNARAKLSR
jgi:hypothetical protein